MNTTMKATLAVMAVLAVVFAAFAVQDDADALNADSKLEYFGTDSGAYAYMYDVDIDNDRALLNIVTGFIQTNLYAKITINDVLVASYDPLPASAVVFVDAPAYDGTSRYVIGLYEHIDSTNAVASISLREVSLAFRSVDVTENVKLDGSPITFEDGIYKYTGDLKFNQAFQFVQGGAEPRTHTGYSGGLAANATIEQILTEASYEEVTGYIATLVWSDSTTFSVKYEWNVPAAVTAWNQSDENAKRYVYQGTAPDRSATKNVDVPAEMTINSSDPKYVPGTPYGLEGYEFAGWFTKPVGGTQATPDTASPSTSIYDAIITDIQLGEDAVDLTNSTFTLYAQWTARSYTLAYSPDHISQGRTAEELTYTLSYDQVGAVLNPNLLSDIAFEKGYVFSHWAYQDDATRTLTPGETLVNLDTTFGFAEDAQEFEAVTVNLVPVYDFAVTFEGIAGFDVNIFPYTSSNTQSIVPKDAGYEYIVKPTDTEYLFKIKFSDVLYHVVMSDITGAEYDHSAWEEGQPVYNATEGAFFIRVVPDMDDASVQFTAPVSIKIEVTKLFSTVTVNGDRSSHLYFFEGSTTETTDDKFEVTWSNTIPANGYGILQIKKGSAITGTYQYDLKDDTGGTVEQIRKDTWKLVPTNGADMSLTVTYQEAGADVTDFYLKSVAFNKAEGIIKSYEGDFADGQVQANGMAFRTDADSGMIIYSLLNNRCKIDFYEINIGANDTEPGAQPTDFGGHDAYLFEIKPLEGYSLYALTAQFTAGQETVETALALVDAA